MLILMLMLMLKTKLYALSKKWAAPTAQDAMLTADKIRVGEKVCFFCMLFTSINSKMKND